MTGSWEREPDTLHDAILMAAEELGVSLAYVDVFARVPSGTTKALRSPRNTSAQAVCDALGIDRSEYDWRGCRRAAPPDE